MTSAAGAANCGDARLLTSPRAGVTGTARNWATITKLMALCGDE